MGGNSLHTAPQTRQEDASGYVYLNQGSMGVDPEGSHRQHTFQFHDLAGGNVDVAAMGPNDWVDLTTGKTEGEAVALTYPYPVFRFTFNATGGAGKVTWTSYRTD